MQKIEEAERKEDETLQIKLQDIKKHEGIIGYIMRNSKTAAIDLNNPNKIIDFALLSSTANEVSQNLTKIIPIGEIKNLVVESETTKLLSKKVNEKQITLFMEKSVDHKKITKNLK
jgi:hypothetical protein